jgi:hypothetical protein
MNKFHGKLVAGLATAALFGALGSAQAQDQGTAPAAAPAWSPPPAAPPAASSDMSGQLGLGVGLSAGTSLAVPGATLITKYWLSDSLAVLPQLALKIYKTKGQDTNWAIAPSAIIAYCPWKNASTRLSVGGGLGLEFAKWGAPAAGTAPGTPPNLGAQRPQLVPPAPDTYIGFTLPIYVGLEHFFARWFSMGIALQNNFLEYGKQGTPWVMAFGIDNVNSFQALGYLLFYTD